MFWLTFHLKKYYCKMDANQIHGSQLEFVLQSCIFCTGRYSFWRKFLSSEKFWNQNIWIKGLIVVVGSCNMLQVYHRTSALKAASKGVDLHIFKHIQCVAVENWDSISLFWIAELNLSHKPSSWTGNTIEWMTPLFKINNNPNTRVVPSEHKALLPIGALVNRILK